MPYLKKSRMKSRYKSYKRDQARKNRMKVYNDIRWIKMRNAHLMQFPLCELCDHRGIITPAVDVHHKESFIEKDGNINKNKAFNTENLVSLCKRCHGWLHKGKKTHGLDMDAAAEQLNKIYGEFYSPQ